MPGDAATSGAATSGARLALDVGARLGAGATQQGLGGAGASSRGPAVDPLPPFMPTSGAAAVQRKGTFASTSPTTTLSRMAAIGCPSLNGWRSCFYHGLLSDAATLDHLVSLFLRVGCWSAHARLLSGQQFVKRAARCEGILDPLGPPT